MTTGEKEFVRFNSFTMSHASATKVTDFVNSTLGKRVPSVSGSRVRFSSQILLRCITGSSSPWEAINILGCTERPFAGVLPTLRITKFTLTWAAPSGVNVSGLSMDVSIDIHGLCDNSSCRAVASAVLFAALETCWVARDVACDADKLTISRPTAIAPALIWTTPFHQGTVASWDSSLVLASMTVVFKIIRGVDGGLRSGSSSALFRRFCFSVRLASEVTTTSKANATTSGKIRAEALLLFFFKQILPAGEQAVGLDFHFRTISLSWIGPRRGHSICLFHRQTGE